ncbi:hypothetical protein RclHR1_31370001 [Rhizophagus clarus]|uniref:Uncharacterized protein n=1 Tax=Rhizophagus clarus TaxID=94130 RepID=A0A2Z6R6S0_9GLOM|nr:hypothetical protein RclHR1_31370001 [Rhizophagus clarus]
MKLRQKQNQDQYCLLGVVFLLAKELNYVAQRIFGICVNAASVKRLRSSIGFLHTKRCNRLHKVKENIAKPIIPNDEENLNLKIENKNQNSDDSEDIEENNESQITLNWNNLIDMWDQLLLQEKVAEEQAETESDLEIDNNVKLMIFY